MPRTIAAWLMLALLSTNPMIAREAAAQSAEDLYQHGTDIGMLYLSEQAGRLRVTLLLQERGFGELASTVGAPLPDAVQFFMEKHGAATWEAPALAVAAQITRSYLLGYEAGVRTEFRRQPSDERRRATCSIAAAAAGQLMQKSRARTPAAADGPLWRVARQRLLGPGALAAWSCCVPSIDDHPWGPGVTGRLLADQQPTWTRQPGA